MSQSPATLYLNGTAIGCCDLTLPEPEVEAFNWQATHSFSFTIRGKKGRRMKAALHRLAIRPADCPLVDLCRGVKHAQLRKRWLKHK